MSTEIPNLLELQLQLRRAVLGGDTAGLVAAIPGDGLDPAARLRIYRNHSFATLGAVLEGTFPVVCRLVDKRFFAYAAHEYLREHPPHSRCLVEYGAEPAGMSPDAFRAFVNADTTKWLGLARRAGIELQSP